MRKWERAGLLHPRRDPETGYRVYSPADVRDTRLAHQLRRGGYLLRQISPLVEQVRNAGGIEPLKATLEGWRAGLTARGLSMLAAAAELSDYLGHATALRPPPRSRKAPTANSRAFDDLSRRRSSGYAPGNSWRGFLRLNGVLRTSPVANFLLGSSAYQAPRPDVFPRPARLP